MADSGFVGAYGNVGLQDAIQTIRDRAVKQAQQQFDNNVRLQQAAQQAKYQDAQIAGLNDERAAHADQLRQTGADRVEAGLNIGDVVSPPLAGQLRMANRESALAPEPMQAPAAPDALAAGPQGGAMAGTVANAPDPAMQRTVYTGNAKQRTDAEQKILMGRLISEQPTGSRERSALEYEQATGRSAPAGMFDPKPAASGDGNYLLGGKPIVAVKQNGRLINHGNDVTDQVTPYVPPNQNGANAESTRLDKSYQFNSGQLEKVRTPIAAKADRMAELADTLTQQTPAADALAAPLILSIAAGGQGSGLRMNEAEISRIVGGRSAWQNLQGTLQHWNLDPSKALTLTPEQRGQMQQILHAANGRLQQKVDAVNEAGQALVDAPDVQTHRRVMADLNKKLAAMDTGGGAPTAAPAASAGSSAVPANVAAALKGAAPGKHTLSDGSVWLTDASGAITKQ